MTDQITTTIQSATSRVALSHLNFMGGTSFDLRDPIVRLRSMAASSFFGEPQYYRDAEDGRRGRNRAGDPAVKRSALSEKELQHLSETLDRVDPRDWRGLTPQQAMERAIDAALDHDVEATLRLAVELRTSDHIRRTPQVIAVRAANHKAAKGTGLIRRYAGAVIQRADEAAVQLAYQLATYGRPIPGGLKRAWTDALKGQSQFQIAKWRKGAGSASINDVVALTHARGEALDLLMKDDLVLGGEGMETWESIRSAGGSWDKAVGAMGHMALLRNLRNLVEADIDPALWVDRFIDGAATGKQMPFRYVAAHQAVKEVSTGSAQRQANAGLVLSAVETALEASLANLPSLPGRSLVLTDNSGSAQGSTSSSMGTMKVATIGNLMGVLTARSSAGGGVLGVFGDQVEFVPMNAEKRTLETVRDVEQVVRKKITGGTEHGIWLALDSITGRKEVFDNIFIYSDMQAGHGGLYGTGQGYAGIASWPGSSRYHPTIDVPALIRRYRREVNPNAMVFMVQIAGYEDTIVPEFYDRTFILGGWSDGILRFARRMIDIHEQR